MDGFLFLGWVAVCLQVQSHRAIISNSIGVIVKALESDSKVLDVTDLSKGVYLIQINSSEGVAQSKFVKE